MSQQSPPKAAGPKSGRAGISGLSNWTDAHLFHLLNNGLGQLNLIASALLTADMPRPRAIRHLQVLQQQVQYLALVTQAWEVQSGLQQGKLPWDLDLADVHDILLWTLQPYDRETLGIEAHCRHELPQVLCDRNWLTFALRCLVHPAVMEGQRCQLQAYGTDEGKVVRLTIRRHGEVLGNLTPTAMKLLQEACRQLIEKHGGSLSISDRHQHDWRATIELPWAGA